MAYEFLLPDLGEGLTEATVIRWLVPVGGEVAVDQPLLEVETDKAVTEMPAPRAGVLLHQGAGAGEVLRVGEVLAVIGTAGEDWEPGRGAGGEAPAAVPPPIVGTLEDAGVAGAPLALPAVRRLAAELDVDLAGVAGSGPGGRITRADVEAAAAGPSAEDVERVRLSPTRLAIARNLTRSWQEIPHVTTYDRADAAALLAARSRLAAETGAPAPLEAVMIGALIPALVEYPEFNATVEGEHLLLRRHYDIGVAVDTPEGLMVVVVRGADGATPAALAAEITRLAGAARERRIRPEELRGATFTVSNIGAVGGGFGTPIIPYGTTAILSVGRAGEAPAVREGRVVVAREFPLSLSYDHRVVDGALGRRFLAAVVGAFEGA